MQSVTRTFRDKLKGRYPGLESNPAYWRFIHYLVFGTHRDDRTGELVISREVLASMEDAQNQLASRNYVAESFLHAFRRDVLPSFRYSDYAYAQGRARVVTDDGLDADVTVWLEDMTWELATGDADVVEVETGHLRTRARESAHEAADLQLVTRRMTSQVAPETRDVIAYQNGLAKRGFSDIVRAHGQAANSAVQAIQDPTSRQQALAALSAVLMHPKPIIGPAENSARAFNIRLSLLSLKSDVRRVFTQGWVDYDLKSAQLAIVARTWDIPELRAFLASGESVWSHLANELGVPEASKPAIKEAVYSLVFGAAKGTISSQFAAALGLDDDRGFFDVDLIRIVYDAREREAKKVMDARGGETVLGRHITISYGSWSDRMDVARSILAQQAQALELRLMHPIYELAKDTNQFHVMLYQFDGVTVRYRDKRSAPTWHKRITDVVANRAEELGIQTSLECEPGDAFGWDLS